MSDNMPDFDNMSPEDMQRWLETLAKGQGATEGLFTSADMEIAYVDPATAVIDGPGYVPFGEENKAQPKAPSPSAAQAERERAAQAEQERAAGAAQAERERAVRAEQERAARAAQLERERAAQAEQERAARAAQAERERAVRAEQERAARAERERAAQVEQERVARAAQAERERAARAAQLERERATQAEQERVARAEQARAAQAAPAEEIVDSGALAWLESLAAGQSDDLFNLDLSGVPVTSNQAPVISTPDNPMSWLEDLARSQGGGQEPIGMTLERFTDDDDLPLSEKIDPFASAVDPVEWLETLAARQGADVDELITPAQMNIPMPPANAVEDNLYTPSSFDSFTRSSRSRAEIDNDELISTPTNFLDSLAREQGYGDGGLFGNELPPLDDDEIETADLSMQSIQSALSSGTVTSDQIQFFLDQQAEHLAQNPDLLVSDDDDEEEKEKVLTPEIPDWLRAMQPVDETASGAPTMPLEALFEVEEDKLSIPEWLRETESEADSDSEEMMSIFAAEERTPAVSAMSPRPSDIDPNDPWVEAFDLEHDSGAINIDQVPEWYEQNVHDAARIAAVERSLAGDDSALEDLVVASLPAEATLPIGAAQSVPNWVTWVGVAAVSAQAMPVAEPETPFITRDVPEWLKDIEVPDDVPSWILETFPQEEEEVFNVFEEAPAPPVVVAPVAVVPKPVVQAPAPARVDTRPPVIAGFAGETLQTARDQEQGGDIEGSLALYESLIRSNQVIDDVVADLSLLVRSYRAMPAVYRLLGDGLMRQGKLQDALNTYRDALNQL